MLKYMRSGLMRASAGVVIGLAWLGAATDAMAVPSTARQTGYQCSKCHAGYPELTNFGRQFKLTGYTMSSDQWDDASVHFFAERRGFESENEMADWFQVEAEVDGLLQFAR